MKTLKKSLAVLLAVLVCLLPLAGLTASAAVTYPEGVSKAKVTSSIPALDKLVSKLLTLNEQTADLNKTVYSSLCSDATLNSLFSTVYGEIAGNENTLTSLGVSVTPAALSNALADYPDVRTKLASCRNLADAVKLSAGFKWGVNSKESFANAVAKMFSPFNNLLFTILCSGTIQINNFLAVKGADGYKSAIVPLFEALECPSIMSQADFTAAANSSRNNMVKNIVYMLYSSIDAIIEKPVEKLTGILPHIAWYLKSGALSASIKTLIDPLTVRVGIISIPGITSLLQNSSLLENSGDMSTLFSNIDFSALAGSDMDLTLPELDIDALAACGTENADGTFTPDKADALILILNYLLDTVRQNSDKLVATAGDQMGDILKKLLAKDNNSIIKVIFIILDAGETPRNKTADYTYPAHTPVPVNYPEGLTVNDMEKVVQGMDELITQILQESDPDANVEDTFRKMIYSDKVLGSLIAGVFGALDSEDFAPVAQLLGISVSTSAVASYLSKYSSAASAIRKAGSWKKVNGENLNFGIKEGDRDAFEKVLTAALRPFTDVLKFAFAGGTLTIADVLSIKGTNGYTTVVIPVLEALGCDNQSIVAYSGYAMTDDAVITDILNPVLGLVDKICAHPVEMICTILPNVIYFMNSGLLPQMIQNLIYPITAMLSDAGLDDLLPADMFSGLTDSLDFNKLLENIDLSSLGLDINLPTPDINSLAALGTAEERVSKMSAGGTSVRYTYIVADRPAVMYTLLHYLVSVIKMPENSGMLTGLLSSSSDDSSQSAGPDMMSMYAGNITEKFGAMTTEEIVVWLYNLFFSETPTVIIDDEPEEIPHIYYKPDHSLSPLQIFGLIVGLALLALLVIWILLHLGYLEGLQAKLDKRKHKKEKKKQDKQKKKMEREMLKASMRTDIVYSSELDGAGRKGMKAADTVEKKAASHSKAPAAAATTAAAASAAKPAQKTGAQDRTSYVQPVSNRAQNPTMSPAQMKKLEARRKKAAEQALKNTKKADKYYQKALKQSEKR